VKLSSSQVLAVPLPDDDGAWAVGADAARAAHEAAAAGDRQGWTDALTRLGSAMARAYRSDEAVLDWWQQRRPVWR
jgi:hypothetical protein